MLKAKEIGMMMIYGGLPPMVKRDPRIMQAFKEVAARVVQRSNIDALYAKPGTISNRPNSPGHNR